MRAQFLIICVRGQPVEQLFVRERWAGSLIGAAVALMAATTTFASTNCVVTAPVGSGATFAVISPAIRRFLDPQQVRALEAKALKGDTTAAMDLAEFYAFGDKPDRDLEIKWLKKAADGGLLVAKWNLACHYKYDLVPPDHRAAFALYYNCATNGWGQAMVFIGDAYKEGLGVHKDVDKAIVWYEKAARTGKVFAMQKLSKVLLENGRAQEAYSWAKVASDRAKRIPISHSEQDLQACAGHLTPQELALAQTRAQEIDRSVPFITRWFDW